MPNIVFNPFTGELDFTGLQGDPGVGITNIVYNIDGTLTITYGDGSTVTTGNLQGLPGEEVELQASATHIQRRYVGDATWTDLIALEDLKGDTGNGIDTVELISTIGKVKTYRITFTDSTTFDYIVTDGEDGEGIGDMVKSIYDPNDKNGDAFSMDNMVETATKKILTSAERTKLAGLVSNADHTGDVTGATALTINKTAITGKAEVIAQDGADFMIISDTSDSGELKKSLIDKPITTINNPNLDTLLTPGVYRITGTATSSNTNWATNVTLNADFGLTLLVAGNGTTDGVQLMPLLGTGYMGRNYISSVWQTDVTTLALTDEGTGDYTIYNGQTFSLNGTATGKTQIATANTSATDYVATLPAKTGTIAMTSDIVPQVEDSIVDGHTTIAPSGNAVFDALALKQNTSEKGAANGYVPLGSDTKISSTYLPSYVNDVIEVANYAALPVTGETGVLYITLDTNYEYRRSGSVYVEIKDSGETASSLGVLINSLTAKTTPVDADMFGIMDSAASNIMKKLSWANVKTTLKTYFDTLYQTILGKATGAEVDTGTDDAKFVTAKAIADSKLSYIDGTETLTNKTITSPKINEAVNVTATSTELNILDGATISTTELNYVDGVTSNIQTQLNTVGKRIVEMVLIDDATALTTGDGKGKVFIVPVEMNGWNLVSAQAAVTTVSSSGTPTYQIRNITQTADMLSTRITIDASEFTSYTATAAPVIDTANDDVVTGDRITVDKDVAGTGEKGDVVILTFMAP